jgi:mono/diheme cytochrome c family protein
MRYLAIAMILATFLMSRCSLQHKSVYTFPDTFPEARRAELKAACDKGKILYKAHCTECHGIFTKGKDGVPNFTNIQIDNYSVRFLRRDPGNHAVAMHMSPEQLTQVLTYLTYKRPKNPDSAKLYRKQ